MPTKRAAMTAIAQRPPLAACTACGMDNTIARPGRPGFAKKPPHTGGITNKYTTAQRGTTAP